MERVDELNSEIENLLFSGNPEDWKRAYAQKLIVTGFLEARSVLQNAQT